MGAVTTLSSSAGGAKSATLPTVSDFTRKVASDEPLLYISDSETATVNIYSQGGNAEKLIGQIVGVYGATGLAVDRRHNLWVYVGAGRSTILGYHRGSYVPFAALRGAEGESGVGLAVDSTGSVYASSINSNIIYIYPKGSTKPTRRLRVHELRYIYNIAVDSRGDLFCKGVFVKGSSDTQYLVVEVPFGSLHGEVLQGQQDNFGGVAIGKNADLLVQDGGKILTYPKPYTGSPTSSIPVPGAFPPIAVTSTGDAVWVPGAPNKKLKGLEYSLPDGTLLGQTTGPALKFPQGLAVDPPARF